MNGRPESGTGSPGIYCTAAYLSLPTAPSPSPSTTPIIDWIQVGLHQEQRYDFTGHEFILTSLNNYDLDSSGDEALANDGNDLSTGLEFFDAPAARLYNDVRYLTRAYAFNTYLVYDPLGPKDPGGIPITLGRIDWNLTEGVGCTAVGGSLGVTNTSAVSGGKAAQPSYALANYLGTFDREVELMTSAPTPTLPPFVGTPIPCPTATRPPK